MRGAQRAPDASACPSRASGRTDASLRQACKKNRGSREDRSLPLVFSVGAGIQAENPVDFDHECPGRQVGLTLAYLAGGNGPGKGVVFISEKAGPKSLLRYTVVVSNSGPSDVTGASVQDALPSQLASATWTAVNGGGGTAVLTSSAGTTYTPGQQQTLTLTITDSRARVYGFQASARVDSNSTNGQAGNFTPGASQIEALRRRDFETMTTDELTQAKKLIAGLRLPIPDIGTRRLQPDSQFARVMLARARTSAGFRGPVAPLASARVAPHPCRRSAR